MAGVYEKGYWESGV